MNASSSESGEGGGPNRGAASSPTPSAARRRAPIGWRILVWAVSLAVLVAGGLVAYVYLFPEKIAKDVVMSWRRNAHLVTKEVELPEGERVAYLEGGVGEPLLLIHGFGADKDTFAPVSHFLTAHFRVVIPDLPGFGESSRSLDADYSPPAQVERLRGFVRALGLGRVHLGGNSMGGQIALAYAARHGSEVASLWLLAPAGVWSAPKSEMLEAIAAGKRNPMLIETEDQFAELFALVMTHPPVVPRPVLRVMAGARIRNLELERRLFPRITGFSVEELATGIAVPTLIVWGERDRALHAGGAEILHRRMPRSEVVLLPEIGHLPMVEAPERVAADYRRFRTTLQEAERAGR